MTQVKPVLFVLSSAAQLLNGDAAGWYLPEAAHPALVLDAAGIPIEFASPVGGAAPLNPASVDMFKDEESVKFLLEWKDKYENTKKLSECQAEDNSAVFVVGGHGPMIDLSADMGFARLVEDFYNAKKPVSAICHGPAALVNAKTATGDSILKGKQVNGLSNAEEAKFINFAELEKYLPFSLEDRLNELSEGGYVKADVMQCKVVYDGGILTGQNPASGKAMGEKLVELLRA